MKKEQYKKSQRLKRVMSRSPEINLRIANATVKVVEALGPLKPKSRRNVIDCIRILYDLPRLK